MLVVEGPSETFKPGPFIAQKEKLRPEEVKARFRPAAGKVLNLGALTLWVNALRTAQLIPGVLTCKRGV